MDLKDYFENVKGTGVLATADGEGVVNAAVYARPHFLDPGDDQTVSFIMSPRVSHANVQANPSAAYLFVEEGPGYKGLRLTLTKLHEETDPEKIEAVSRRCPSANYDEKTTRYLVFFRVGDVRPLVSKDG